MIVSWQFSLCLPLQQKTPGLWISQDAANAAQVPSEISPDFSTVADPKICTWSWPEPAGQPGEEEQLMDPTGSHSATNTSEVRETNWTFNLTLAQEALCSSWREGRKIHSSAAAPLISPSL